MKKNIFDRLDLFFNSLKWGAVALIGFLIAFVLSFFSIERWIAVLFLSPLAIQILYITIRTIFKKQN